MKIIFTLSALLIITFVQSQTHRFIYELKYKMDSTESGYEKLNMILDITPKEVKFYGQNLMATDSLNKKFGMNSSYTDMSGQVVKRKVNSFDHENFINIKAGYYSFRTTDKINWMISDEVKKVEHYTLQKATADFGGRSWTAWFCKDIPFNEGPFKFRGLPGLIFELSDSNKNFIYHLLKSETLTGTPSTEDFLESNFGNKAVPINEKQKQKLLLEFYNDPFAFERNTISKTATDLNININGKEIRNVDELNTQTKSMQEVIRKYNNPIEIDKAMHYKINK
ncbi:GLPGLI family protein [Chryseobacterium sp. PTM-20240506]|uniref:GLPGLI family protein n=1 Tax=unclassified Chryseobacterium TaxID=2593645 RepID=UPI002358D551|nr:MULTISPECIES: GLPGLI family protein [unclassified Chryseobacterium]MDC8103249.1 GLPGLI family protein [Chryseobacterium sp. B21-037]MDQ1802801.1 GLPGLI family protein [Chryseobacterium sp. CKR4-1]